jgi:hypothetical protein
VKRDFTLKIFSELLTELKNKNYEFITFSDFKTCKKEKAVILRHDIDKLTDSTLKIAEMQINMGIQGTYYFRILKCSFDADVIKIISSMGHEIGYHYEDLAIAEGDYEKAYGMFKDNLNEFRKNCEVKTICMHGSPLSKWDNKLLWEKYSYRDLGIVGEPYFDINFNEIFYLTDTGRRWDGKISVRDKVNSKFKNKYTSTYEIINSIKDGTFPPLVLFTVHPQRWCDGPVDWTIEIINQNIKNVIKKIISR